MRSVRFVLLLLLSVTLDAVLTAGETHAAEQTSVSQWGITWTFDGPHEVGQYVNGDWWVVGPVTIVSVSPAPSTAMQGEVYYADGNQFGDVALQIDDRRRHGSMVVLGQGTTQGYDSRVKNYDPSQSITFPYTLAVDRSLVSTESLKNTVGNPNFMQGHWEEAWAVLKTAAVLTAVASPPPADAFRPPYVGTDKPVHRASALRRHLLPRLSSVPSTPSWSLYERYFERVWIDHQHTWYDTRIFPLENMPGYGREMSRIVSMASLMLSLDVPDAQKEKLLIGFVQHGIDLAGVMKAGGTWPGEGGMRIGRKWPVVFASILLGDPDMAPDVTSTTSVFSEDQQTYYGQGFDGATALFQMGVHHGIAPPYEEKDPATWDAQDQKSESYRNCCTSIAWVGTALAAHHLRARAAWSHDAFFDYADRWMAEEGSVWDAFVNEMWAAHRASAPAQAGAPENLKWVWSGGPWIDNPPPTPASPGPLPPVLLPLESQ